MDSLIWGTYHNLNAQKSKMRGVKQTGLDYSTDIDLRRKWIQ